MGTTVSGTKIVYDLLIGQDLSVCASYYEPWGYTPLEASLSVSPPSPLSDLAVSVCGSTV